MYFKCITEFEIVNNNSNNGLLNKIIDVDNSWDVDFNEMKNFFEKHVMFENFKIKDVGIPELKYNKAPEPNFIRAITNYSDIILKIYSR